MPFFFFFYIQAKNSHFPNMSQKAKLESVCAKFYQATNIPGPDTTECKLSVPLSFKPVLGPQPNCLGGKGSF